MNFFSGPPFHVDIYFVCMVGLYLYLILFNNLANLHKIIFVENNNSKYLTTLKIINTTSLIYYYLNNIHDLTPI